MKLIKVNLMRLITLFILFVLSNNCFSQNSIVKDTAFFTENDISYDVQILDTKYIINRLGANVKRMPNDSSTDVGVINYGQAIDIIEELGEWVGIRDRFHQIIKNSKGQSERWAWEKFYVRVKYIGESHEIKLDSSDLYKSVIYKDGDFVIFDAGEYFSIQLVSKQEYEDRLKDKVEFVIYDTLLNVKENGKLILKTKNKNIEFTDTITDDTCNKINYYFGQIPKLNKYIVKRELYEYVDNLFVDKLTGEITQTNYDIYLSRDEKYVIAIYVSPYDENTNIQLYEVKNKSILKLITEFYFTEFMLAYDKVNYFTKDNYLYLVVNNSSTYFINYEKNKEDFQYIKIKILE